MIKYGKIYIYNVKKIGVSMDIFGTVLFMLLPYVAGYSCKRILRWRETNQIETYLIGFFFLFFLQGLILVPCVWLGISLTFASYILLGVLLILALIAFIFVASELYSYRNVGIQKKGISLPGKKAERTLFFIMIAVFLLLVVRMVINLPVLREDIVLETALTTLQTDSLFVAHPLKGSMMEAGMIASKKIVTLPLFYACMMRLTGVNAEVFLNLITSGMVLVCSYHTVSLLFSKVTTPVRGKIYLCRIIYGLMILAGDYHLDTLSYRLLYRGYEGTTICFGVILPYLLYLIVSWYKLETGEETVEFGVRITYLLKIMLPLATSVVITGLGTGFVFLFMAMVVAGICCVLKSLKEVRACRE